MALQGGQARADGPPQLPVAGDKGQHLQPRRLEGLCALQKEAIVQAGLRSGIEIVHGHHPRPGGGNARRVLRAGGGGVDHNGNMGGQGGDLFCDEPVVHPDRPDTKPFGQPE